MPFRLIVGIAFIGVLFVTASPPRAASAPSSQQVRRLLDGERLFQGYCTACHGRAGKGDGPAAQALKTRPADLTLIARHNGGTFPHERVAKFIASGEPATAAHGSKEMPVWGPVFVGVGPDSFEPINRRIEDLVRYLESIQSQ